MYNFDVVFLDVTSLIYYDRITLEKSALGGSEASVIRIAEGLGKLGLKVAVIEARLSEYFAPTIGQHAYFFHSDDVDKLQCKHYVQIRANTNPQLFPYAKKYIWLHDICTKGREDLWIDDIKAYDITLIGVSRYHKNNIKEITGLDSKYIYNPVPDEIFIGPDTKLEYDKNIIVWLSSPHKGLERAVQLFDSIKLAIPKMQFIVFNPGYYKLDSDVMMTKPGMSIYGSMNCKQMWSVVQKSLCVFYPTTYLETFGLVAAEANALGTPIATNSIGALKEVVSSDAQLHAHTSDCVTSVIDWHNNGRPKVLGKDEFRESSVLIDWVKLLAR